MTDPDPALVPSLPCDPGVSLAHASVSKRGDTQAYAKTEVEAVTWVIVKHLKEHSEGFVGDTYRPTWLTLDGDFDIPPIAKAAIAAVRAWASEHAREGSEHAREGDNGAI